MQTGGQLCLLFATILLHCLPAEPAVLWNNHKVKIYDDLRARLINHHYIPEPTDDQVFYYGLYLINRLLLQSAKDLTHFPLMPLPEGDWNQHNDNDNYLLQEQLELDPYDLLLRVQHDKDLFNNEQQAAYDAFMYSINHKKGKAFFLHSAGGSGKTFVCNTVASTVHSNEHVALAVASSAVAAQILELGCTCHSRFKIPIPIHKSSTCRIEKHGELAEIIRQTDVIIHDEAPMQHCHCIEALNRTLQDIRNDARLFEGITMLFGGDFIR